MNSVATPSEVRDLVGPEEWQLRIDLAACYRLVAMYGWSDLIFTHISARVPGPEHHFLINPYGLMFDEITASNLVKIDQQCNKIIDSPHPVNPAGFVIHSAVHAAREDLSSQGRPLMAGCAHRRPAACWQSDHHQDFQDQDNNVGADVGQSQ